MNLKRGLLGAIGGGISGYAEGKVYASKTAMDQSMLLAKDILQRDIERFRNELATGRMEKEYGLRGELQTESLASQEKIAREQIESREKIARIGASTGGGRGSGKVDYKRLKEEAGIRLKNFELKYGVSKSDLLEAPKYFTKAEMLKMKEDGRDKGFNVYFGPLVKGKGYKYTGTAFMDASYGMPDMLGGYIKRQVSGVPMPESGERQKPLLDTDIPIGKAGPLSRKDVGESTARIPQTTGLIPTMPLMGQKPGIMPSVMPEKRPESSPSVTPEEKSVDVREIDTRDSQYHEGPIELKLKQNNIGKSLSERKLIAERLRKKHPGMSDKEIAIIAPTSAMEMLRK